MCINGDLGERQTNLSIDILRPWMLASSRPQLTVGQARVLTLSEERNSVAEGVEDWVDETSEGWEESVPSRYHRIVTRQNQWVETENRQIWIWLESI